MAVFRFPQPMTEISRWRKASMSAVLAVIGLLAAYAAAQALLGTNLALRLGPLRLSSTGTIRPLAVAGIAGLLLVALHYQSRLPRILGFGLLSVTGVFGLAAMAQNGPITTPVGALSKTPRAGPVSRRSRVSGSPWDSSPLRTLAACRETHGWQHLGFSPGSGELLLCIHHCSGVLVE
jgi:hypothetical protein